MRGVNAVPRARVKWTTDFRSVEDSIFMSYEFTFCATRVREFALRLAGIDRSASGMANRLDQLTRPGPDVPADWLFISSHHAQAKWRWRPLGRALVSVPAYMQTLRCTGRHRHVACRRDVAAAWVGTQG
jgi:hypothetical protein